MNYKNCIPTKRFEVGDLILPNDWNIKSAREITEVLKIGYNYKYKNSDEIFSSKDHNDPYMIWWGKVN